MSPMPQPPRSRGFSLMELMVALTISLLLVLGVIGVVINSSNGYNELTKTGQQVENGRYAMELLKEDIRHAGFWGEWVSPNAQPVVPASACLNALADLQTMLPPIALQSFSNAPTCITGTPVPDSGILVVRRLATGTTQNSGFWLHTNARNARIDSTVSTAPFGDGTAPLGARAYLTRIYYVRGCSRCDGTGDGIPTLWRTELVAGAWRSEPVVEGIENLQIEYGIDRNGNGQPNESTPGVSRDAFVATPTTDEWRQVVAARVHILARNIEPSVGYLDNKTYVLGESAPATQNVVGPFADGFRRHPYSMTVRAMNTFLETNS